MLVPHPEIADVVQPMGVAPVGAAAVAESQVEDLPTTLRFTWTIEHFSRLRARKHYSEVFMVGGYKWRVLMFPKGNKGDHLSMYLNVADAATLPHGWSIYAQWSLLVIDQLHNKFTIRKESQSQFDARERDWGFTSFMPLSDLHDPSRGYIVNDTCIVKAEVAVRKLEDGDIICYQKSPPPASEEQYRYPDVPSFLEYIHNRQPDYASSDEETASTESEEVDDHGVKPDYATSDEETASTESEEVDDHGVKVTVEGDASIAQPEDPAKEGEAISTEDQTLVCEALAFDISVEATKADAQESAQGDGGEISVEPSSTTPVLQGEQVLVAPLASSARPPALTSMSSAGVSMSHSIKSELPKRRVDLSIDRIQDIVVKADAAGCANLTDQLISLYTLVEDLHSSQCEVPLTALAELQKAQEVAAQYRTEQEIDKSLVVGEHKVAALESTLTWAKGEVRELKRQRLALTPPAPQVIQTLRREAIKQDTLNRISRAKVEMLEVEYEKILLSLE